jgi:hypothetical protein
MIELQELDGHQKHLKNGSIQQIQQEILVYEQKHREINQHHINIDHDIK